MNLKRQTDDIRHRLNRLSILNSDSQLNFAAWCRLTSPKLNWDWDHIQYLIPLLEEMMAGRLKRLMISAPPRHGKTELISIHFAAASLINDPIMRIILASYGQGLAEKNSRRVRRIVGSQIALSDEKNAADDWETAAGGGVLAVGMGTGVTGRGADLLIIDDPIQSRQKADSIKIREQTHEWFKEDLFSRLEPEGRIVLISTRWHQDDLAGRLLLSRNADQWTTVNLTAFAEENDLLGRAPGTPLCPERYDEEALREIRNEMGSHKFQALYQGQPLPPEGGLFKRGWFVIEDSGPELAYHHRFWDLAATEDGGDFTCGVLMARSPEGVFYVEDVVRGQWSPGKRNEIIRQVAESDRQRYGKVSILIEQEGGSGGKEAAQAIVDHLAGFHAKAVPVRGSKMLRAEPFAAMAEISKVRVVRGPWNDDFLDELTTFPYGTHDDQVDASSGAFNKKASNFIDYLEQRFQRETQPDLRTIAARIFQAEMQKEIDWLEGSDYDDRRQR